MNLLCNLLPGYHQTRQKVQRGQSILEPHQPKEQPDHHSTESRDRSPHKSYYKRSQRSYIPQRRRDAHRKSQKGDNIDCWSCQYSSTFVVIR